jgi:hypothetical protein
LQRDNQGENPAARSIERLPTKEWLGVFKAIQTQMLSKEFAFSGKHARIDICGK